MKKLLTALLMLFFSAAINVSCTKTDLKNPSSSQNFNSDDKANPNVIDCGMGYHWDFYLKKCVQTCSTGYHNDSITGACVVDGGGQHNISVITSPNNPDDYIGGQHNNGVSSIFPTINPNSNNLDSVILVDVKSYVASIGYNADSSQSFYNKAVQNGYFPFSHLQELDSLGNIMYAKGLLSSYGNNYVQQIYNYAYQYLNTDTITNAKYNSFANSLITLEATIKNDSRISSWEKEVLLSSCSIGRYSGSYWGNYSNGNILPELHPLFLKKLKNWMRCVIGDIGGAIVGIVGGPVGIVTGAVGTSIATAATLDWSQNN